MGWLRLAGSMKLQISLAECSLFYRALLQKRLVIWSILPIEATPQSLLRGVFGICAFFLKYLISGGEYLQIHLKNEFLIPVSPPFLFQIYFPSCSPVSQEFANWLYWFHCVSELLKFVSCSNLWSAGFMVLLLTINNNIIKQVEDLSSSQIWVVHKFE